MESLQTALSDKKVYLILAVVTVVLYGCSLQWDFVYDDIALIRDNHRMGSLNFIGDFFTKGVWHAAELTPQQLSEKSHDYYHPLHMSLLAFIGWASGLRAGAFHAVNILLQISNSALVYHFIKRFLPGANALIPFVGALLFAVHPVHAESVNWICGGIDLWQTLFLVGSFLAHLRGSDDQQGVWRVTSVALFVFALLTKEVAVIFPAVIVAYDVIVARKARFGIWALYAGLVVSHLLLRSAVLGSGNLATVELTWSGIATAFSFFGGYLRYMVWPWPLALHPWTFHFGLGTLVAAAIILLAALALSWRDRRALFCLLWFLIFLAPTLCLPLSKDLDQYLFAERYMYLPSVGFCALVSIALARMGLRRKQLVVGGIAAIAISMGVVTAIACQNWRNNDTLFRQVMNAHPEEWDLYAAEGEKYERLGKFDKAITLYTEAQYSSDPKVQADGLARTGRAYAAKGQVGDAVKSLKQALSVDPNSVSALLCCGVLSSDYQTASGYFNRVLQLDRTNPTACFNLIELNEKVGKTGEANRFRALCGRYLTGGEQK